MEWARAVTQRLEDVEVHSEKTSNSVQATRRMVADVAATTATVQDAVDGVVNTIDPEPAQVVNVIATPGSYWNTDGAAVGSVDLTWDAVEFAQALEAPVVIFEEAEVIDDNVGDLDGEDTAVIDPEPVDEAPQYDAEAGLPITIIRYEVWGRKTYIAPELPDADVSEDPVDDITVPLAEDSLLDEEPAFLRLTTSQTASATVLGLEMGTDYTFIVRAIATSEVSGPFSDELDVTTPANLPVMAAPTTPIVTSELGVVSVEWDGLMSDGQPPVQFSGVFAQISDSETGIYTSAGQNLLIAGKSVIPGLVKGNTYWVHLVGIDRLNQVTTPSAAVSVVVVGVDLGDLEAAVTEAIDSAQAAGTAGQEAAATAQSAADSADAKAAQALLDAANAKQEAIDVAAADAQAKADAAQQAAIDAAAITAQAKADAAKAAATTAAAADAQAKADAAQAAAIDAAATTAQLKADGAEQAAIDAAAITAQSKADAAKQAAIDAAALTAQAKADAAKSAAISAAATDATTKADAAKAAAISAAATDATTKMNTALTAANGKNRIIFSTSDATGTADANGVAYVSGDTWFKKSGSLIIGQWEFVSGAWAKRTIDNAVIANLDAGKLTAGTISVDRLAGNSIAASKLIAGTITAASGILDDAVVTTAKIADLAVNNAKIANLDAAKIDVGTLNVDRLNGADVRAKIIAAGKITANDINVGSLQAAIVTATAVSGVTITGTTMQSSPAANTGVKFTSAGIFGYDASGAQKFKLDALTGALTASSGTFTGTVNATAGTISGDLAVTGSMTGGKYLSASSGRRVEISGSSAKFYENGTTGEFGSEAEIYAYSASPNTGNGQLVLEGGSASVTVGHKNMYTSGSSSLQTDGAEIGMLWVDKIYQSNDTGWVNMTYASDYQTQGGTAVAFRRIGDIIYVRGLIDKISANFSANVTYVVGTIPTSFCGNEWIYLPIAGDVGAAQLQILDTGSVRVRAFTACAWLGLSTNYRLN